MSEDLVTFLWKVDNEGLDYAVENYYVRGISPQLDDLTRRFLDAKKELEAHVDQLRGY
jgi:hypothetical protein